MDVWLPVVWGILIATAIGLYVILDGFDLGVGILFPINHGERDRDLMMNSVAPFWDGNETWLVLGGGGLLVAFPIAYSIIMPALYIPVIVMLLALIFRGVSFEFRFVAKPHHKPWDYAFAIGSIVAAFCQGVILGTLIGGITVFNGAFAGEWYDFVGPFSLICGLGLVAGYALLGCGWLMMRVEGDLARRARRTAGWLLVALDLFIVAVSVYTLLIYPAVARRWFEAPYVWVLWIVPVATAALTWSVFNGLRRNHAGQVFLSSVGLFLLCFIGLGVSLWPYIVPPSLTIWQTAAPPQSQIFMLVGTLILLPIVLAYTVFIYRTFWGKLRPGEGYH